jgi:hypothetical protein
MVGAAHAGARQREAAARLGQRRDHLGFLSSSSLSSSSILGRQGHQCRRRLGEWAVAVAPSSCHPAYPFSRTASCSTRRQCCHRHRVLSTYFATGRRGIRRVPSGSNLWSPAPSLIGHNDDNIDDCKCLCSVIVVRRIGPPRLPRGGNRRGGRRRCCRWVPRPPPPRSSMVTPTPCP